MRIATSTIYAQQAAAIDNQAALYQEEAAQLSSGKRISNPSDDPAQIGMDLSLQTTIDAATQQGTNVQSAISELTTTDSSLSALTNVIQSARAAAVQGATETLTDQQRAALAGQVDQLLQQAIAIGNTSYGGKYIFAGTAATANPPVQQLGSPIQQVTFTGNEQVQGQLIYNGQQFALSTTFRAAFNYQATDGSSDVFQTLINLRNTLSNKTVSDESAAAINAPNAVIYGAPTPPGPVAPPATQPAPTTLAATAAFATKPVADSSGNFAIQIHGAPLNGTPSLQTLTFTPADSMATIVAAINGVTAQTGVSASFNAQTQKIKLTSPNSFYVTDVPSAGAAGPSNLTKVLGLNSQADFVNNVTTQLGTIDHSLNTVLNARAIIGARIQGLSAISDQIQTSLTDNKKVQSGIEDVDVAAMTSRFTQTQTALQAAYATTTRLESKTLFDYL